MIQLMLHQVCAEFLGDAWKLAAFVRNKLAQFSQWLQEEIIQAPKTLLHDGVSPETMSVLSDTDVCVRSVFSCGLAKYTTRSWCICRCRIL